MVVIASNAGPRRSEWLEVIQLLAAFIMIACTARLWWNWHEIAFADRLEDKT